MLRIKPALLEEREMLYGWFVQSSGSTNYSLSQFETDFPDFYFDPNYRMAASVLKVVDGEAELACITYAAYYLEPDSVELCIWLKSPALFNQGIATQALQICLQYLQACNGTKKFMLRFSPQNLALLKVCSKHNFVAKPFDSNYHSFIHPKFLSAFVSPFFMQTEVLVCELTL